MPDSRGSSNWLKLQEIVPETPPRPEMDLQQAALALPKVQPNALAWWSLNAALGAAPKRVEEFVERSQLWMARRASARNQ